MGVVRKLTTTAASDALGTMESLTSMGDAGVTSCPSQYAVHQPQEQTSQSTWSWTMPYLREQRMRERNYTDPEEQNAFTFGYYRAFINMDREPPDTQTYLYHLSVNYPNAYSAGYWEGFGDAGHDRT